MPYRGSRALHHDTRASETLGRNSTSRTAASYPTLAWLVAGHAALRTLTIEKSLIGLEVGLVAKLECG